MCVTPFDDEAEAVELANATQYGLAAYVWTNDLRRGHRVAHAIESGHGLAQLAQRARPAHPVRRGQGRAASAARAAQHSLDFYTERQIVHVALGDVHTPRFGVAR